MLKSIQPSEEHRFRVVIARDKDPLEPLQLLGLMRIYALCSWILFTFSGSQWVDHSVNVGDLNTKSFLNNENSDL